MRKAVITCFLSAVFLSIFLYSDASVRNVPYAENVPALRNVAFPITYEPPTEAKTTAKLQRRIFELTEQVNNLQQTIKTLTASSASPETVSKEEHSRNYFQKFAARTPIGGTSETLAKKRAGSKIPVSTTLRAKRSHLAFTAHFDAISDLTLWDETDLKEIKVCYHPFVRQKSQYQDIWDEIERNETSERAETTSLSRLSVEGGIVTLNYSDLDTPELREELRSISDWQEMTLSNETSSLNGILELKDDIFLCRFSNEVLNRMFGSEVTKRFKKDVYALVIPHMIEDIEQKLQDLRNLPKTVNTIIFSLSAGMGVFDLSRLTDINFELEISDFSSLLSYDVRYFYEVDSAKRWKAAVPSAKPYCRNKRTTDKAVISAMRWHIALSKCPMFLERQRNQQRKANQRRRRNVRP